MNFTQLQNDLYEIKETNSMDFKLMFVDFKYSYNPVVATTSNSSFSSTSTTNTMYPTIGPDVFTKQDTLNKITFNEIPTLESIKRVIDNHFFETVNKIADKTRENVISLKFDIDIEEMIKRGMNPTRGIIAKINNASNYIATEGRIGPGQYILMSNKTYHFILSYIGSVTSYSNNKTLIGNIEIVINNEIEDGYFVMGRKNRIEQPGVNCVIMVDDNKNILIEETPYKRYAIYFKIIDVGFHPEKQFMKINSRTISYYRNLKLQRIKEIYG